ncbi:hypothetical protein HDV03_004537 [Kappamyces sp. JEL0829]|nr:hypothetical protein HDV03_004537 [Kappamyces sp. JEL0829]
MSALIACDADTLRPLFVYGSLLNDQVFSRATSGLVPLRRVSQVVLKDHKRVLVKNAPYPAAIPHAGSEIVGDLVYLETVDQVRILDRFESDLYKRVTVAVVVQQDKGITQELADVYLWAKQESQLDVDQEWSYAKFVAKGKMQSAALYDP